MLRLKRQRSRSLLLLIFSLLIAVILNDISWAGEVNLKPPTATISNNLFGMHLFYVARTTERRPQKTPWPSVPFASWRLWDTAVAWIELEPQKGEWDFELLDKSVALAEANQVEILLPLGHPPAWASARPTEPSAYGTPGRAAEPKDIEDWRNYVRAVATRYKGRIRYYEIWNEPNVKKFYSGSIEQMVTLAKEAYEILKQIDPAIVVLSPAGTGGDSKPPDVDGPWWLDEYLSKGGGNYADAIAYHFYVAAAPEAMVPLIERVKTVMAKHDLSQKPLWNTESGWFEKEAFPDEVAAGYVARAYILNWAAGVSRFYWYAWDSKLSSVQILDIENQTLQPAAIAYNEVQKWLVGAQMTECSQNNNDWSCQLSREGNYTAWIVWNPDRRHKFSIPEEWNVQQVRDLAGERRDLQGDRLEIGPAPLLLEKATL